MLRADSVSTPNTKHTCWLCGHVARRRTRVDAEPNPLLYAPTPMRSALETLHGGVFGSRITPVRMQLTVMKHRVS